MNFIYLIPAAPSENITALPSANISAGESNNWFVPAYGNTYNQSLSLGFVVTGNNATYAFNFTFLVNSTYSVPMNSVCLFKSESNE